MTSHFGTFDITHLSNNPLHSVISKGNQKKWYDPQRKLWIKEDMLGYEGTAEFVASLVLEHSTLQITQYVKYRPCLIQDQNKHTLTTGCISQDFHNGWEEVTLAKLFDAYNISTSYLSANTDPFTKFNITVDLVKNLTGINIAHDLSLTLAFDAVILNEDRHLNNIVLLTRKGYTWKYVPIFDNGLSLLSDTKSYPKGIRPPKNYISRVKARPFTTAFKKQAQLYTGKPFINITSLIKTLDNLNKTSPSIDLGRAETILRIQLRQPHLQHLFIK